MSVPVVYRAEQEAGLESLIREGRLSIATVAKLAKEPFLIPERARAAICAYAPAKASVGDADLHYLNDILVSVGWNNNDDVFDPVETWLARATPVDKPFNYQHDCKDIIGHTVGCYAIGVDGKPLAENINASDLPAKFHILAQDVLYKYWEDPELQKRMNQILADIAQGKWFVSMECLFKGFDYALRGPDGTCKVVARSDKTAFLTKHLRVYGGTGSYQEYRVGRLLRHIIFSGKGLVHNPANPQSIILDEPTEFSAAQSEFVEDLATQVYVSSVAQNQKDSQTMTELEILQKKLEAAHAEIETLKQAQRDNDVKAIAADKEKAEAQVAELTKKLEEVAKASEEHGKAVAEQKAQVEKLTKDLDDAKKAEAEVREELNKIYVEQKKNARLAKVKAALKIDETKEEAVQKAVALNDSLSDLSDEKFENVVNTMASQNMMTEPPATNNPADGNTTFPNQAKPKEQPKATDKPTGKGDKDGDGDDDNEKKSKADADPKVLEQAQINEKTAAGLNTISADDGVKAVQRQIAEAFGAKFEE